jgi:hypothetical protein
MKVRNFWLLTKQPHRPADIRSEILADGREPQPVRQESTIAQR